MPPKTKTKSARVARRAHFTIRRIANRNPRSLRNFPRWSEKLRRAAAGLLLFLVLASIAFVSGGPLVGDILGSSEQADFACLAGELDKNLAELESQISTLNYGFPGLLEELQFCSNEANCEVEAQIYAAEEKILELETQIKAIKQQRRDAQKELSASLAELEESALFCVEAGDCATAERALATGQVCAAKFAAGETALAAQNEIAEEYPLSDPLAARKSTADFVKKLNENLERSRARSDKYEYSLERCLEANDAVSCRKYSAELASSRAQEADDLADLTAARTDLEGKIAQLKVDIVDFEISRKDEGNFTPAAGLGWCTRERRETETLLAEKMSAAAGLRQAHESALANLKQKKIDLKEKAEEEVRAEEMHSAAEKAAEIKIEKIKTGLSLWQVIHSIF